MSHYKTVREGLLVSASNNPVGLEAIAMQLGFRGNTRGTDLREAALMIHEALAAKD